MQVVLKFLASLLYSILGSNMYKALRSESGLLLNLARVWNTMIALIRVKDEDTIVKGINRKKDYVFPDIKVHEVLSFSGLVLFKSYAAKVSLKDKYILCVNHFDSFLTSNLAKDCFPCRFDWLSVLSKEFPKEKDKSIDISTIEEKFVEYVNSDEGQRIMTATEWNSFWNNIVGKTSKSIAMKPLEVKYLSINEISALIDTNDVTSGDDSVIYTNIPAFKEIYLYDDENEYPAEFSIICGINEINIGARIVRGLLLDEDSIIEDFEVDEYLFPNKITTQQ